RRRAELSIEAFDAIEAELVVLEEIADLLAAEILVDVLAEDLALDGVVRLPAERVGVIGNIVPAVAAAGYEQIRDFLRGDVIDDRQMSRRSQRAEQGEDLILQDQLAGKAGGVRRIVAVVVVRVGDRAPEDSAMGIQILKVGARSCRDLRIARRRPAGQRLRPPNRERV